MKKILLMAGGLLLVAGLCACGSKDSSRKDRGRTEKTIEKEGEKQAEQEDGFRGMQCSWQEITITLPVEWEERYVLLEDENGFSVYQKDSYNEENGSGYIFGLQRTADYMNYGFGETLLAYTDQGVLYYFMQPTDVSCDTEDPLILGEYGTMCRQAEEIKDSVQIEAVGIHWDAGEYVLPVSSILKLDQNALLNLSDNNLWIAKNEIYARHGRQFSNEYLQKYFNRCTWYKGTTPPEEFDGNSLSRLEQDNLKLLEAAEQEYKRWHPYPKKYSAGDTAVENMSGRGAANEIRYQVTENENGERQCIITVDGRPYIASDLVPMTDPLEDLFYITAIWEDGGVLEIAVLDNGPSEDPVTYFFRYEDTLSYIGQVSGFPFAEENGGINGFNGAGGITGRVRMDLVETAYLEGYWQYDGSWIVYQDGGWNRTLPADAHALYVDLPVRREADRSSKEGIIPAQEEVFFLGSDLYEWILVRGKDGSQGYVHVRNGEITELNRPAEEVFSNLHYFD